MTITLYNTMDDYRKLQKTIGAPLATLTGYLHERVSDIQLVVRVPGTAAAGVGATNYAYIDTLGKYYFREQFEIENNTLLIHLKEDVRMNFATQILATTATVNRSASNWQGFLYDQGYQVLAYKTAAIRNFPTAINDDTMILTTVG